MLCISIGEDTVKSDHVFHQVLDQVHLHWNHEDQWVQQLQLHHPHPKTRGGEEGQVRFHPKHF